MYIQHNHSPIPIHNIGYQSHANHVTMFIRIAYSDFHLHTRFDADGCLKSIKDVNKSKSVNINNFKLNKRCTYYQLVSCTRSMYAAIQSTMSGGSSVVLNSLILVCFPVCTHVFNVSRLF